MSLSLPVIPRLCLTTFTFAQPFLITATLNYVDDPNPNTDYGKGLIGAWVLTYLGLAVSKCPSAQEDIGCKPLTLYYRPRIRYISINALDMSLDCVGG